MSDSTPVIGSNFQDFLTARSEEHTSELQSLTNLVCRLLLEKETAFTRSKSSPSSNVRLILSKPALQDIRSTLLPAPAHSLFTATSMSFSGTTTLTSPTPLM